MKYEHLQQYYPDLDVSEKASKAQHTIELTKPDQGIVAVFRTDNKSANLRINPDHKVSLNIVIPHGEAKPPSLPFWRTLEGLKLLYSMTIEDEMMSELKHLSQKNSLPRFFASGKTTDYRDPFPRLIGTRLLSADFNLSFLQQSEFPTEIVDPLLEYADKEIARVPQLLGVYELRLLMEYTKSGRDIFDNATFMLFCISGFFTKMFLNNGLREFDNEKSTQIVSRKVTKNTTIDDTVLKTSRALSHIITERALAHPFHGGKADGNEK